MIMSIIVIIRRINLGGARWTRCTRRSRRSRSRRGTPGLKRLVVTMYVYTYVYIYIYVVYVVLYVIWAWLCLTMRTRLAETRLAQTSWNYIDTSQTWPASAVVRWIRRPRISESEFLGWFPMDLGRVLRVLISWMVPYGPRKSLTSRNFWDGSLWFHPWRLKSLLGSSPLRASSRRRETQSLDSKASIFCTSGMVPRGPRNSTPWVKSSEIQILGSWADRSWLLYPF